MRKTVLAGILIILTGGALQAEWISYYRNRSDATTSWYNSEKIKNSGGVVTVWTKTGDGYPGKVTIDCNKSTYKASDNMVRDIAPDSMPDALEKVICKKEKEKNEQQ